MRVMDFHTTLLLASCVHFHLFIHHLHFAMSDTLVSRRPNKKLEMLGDINLGALISLSVYDMESRTCTEELENPIFTHLPVSMEYAVSEVNRKKILPRNLTLGIVIFDDCYSVNQAMAQCLRFLPQNMCNDNERLSTDSKSYDVVGVISSYTVAQTKHIAKMLSAAEIPVASFTARSDDLSDKHTYPYFFRTTTSERPLYTAFAQLLRSQNWTYISVVYERDDSGIAILNSFMEAMDKGICLATVESGTMESDQAEIDRIVHALNKTSGARVVVLLTPRVLAQRVIKAASQLPDVPQGYFIWVDLYGWVQERAVMKDLGELLWGLLMITDHCEPNYIYNHHFEKLTKNITRTRVPWFHDFMKQYGSCTLTSVKCNNTLQDFMTFPHSGRAMDTIEMFARAIARILESQKCIEMVKNNKSDRECINGRELRDELFKTSFQTYCEYLYINTKGDRNTTYEICQIQPGDKPGLAYTAIAGAHFDGSTTNIAFSDITWQYHWLPPGKTSPESSCSVPCTKRQAKVIQENKCCWNCHDCRDNEHFTNNGSQCEPCPMYTWPDPDTNYETCKEIPPRVPVLWSTRSLFHIAVAALFTIGCMSIVIFFIRHKNSRIIKASSTLHSFLMLFAIFLGNVTIIMLRLHPNDVICRITFTFFCTSFSLLYAALLTRAFVIYRIFTQGLQSAGKPALTSRADQIKMCFGIVLIELLLTTAVLISYDTWVKKVMADIAEEFVELSCSFPLYGLALFLAYNIIMLALCSYLAYKTRKLPNNFNETFYISMCVMTTLLIWLGLSPSYYITTKQSMLMTIVSLAVVINHFVAIVFLFLPKIYVIVWAEDNFATRYPRATLARASGVTVSSIGSQDFTHTNKKKTRHSVATTRESIGGASDQLNADQCVAASAKAIDVLQDGSESDVDLTDAPSTSIKSKQPEESGGREEPTTTGTPSKPAESTVPNNPTIRDVQSATNEMNSNEKGQVKLIAQCQDILKSLSASNLNLGNDNESISRAGEDSSVGYSESGVDSNKE